MKQEKGLRMPVYQRCSFRQLGATPIERLTHVVDYDFVFFPDFSVYVKSFQGISVLKDHWRLPDAKKSN